MLEQPCYVAANFRLFVHVEVSLHSPVELEKRWCEFDLMVGGGGGFGRGRGVWSTRADDVRLQTGGKPPYTHLCTCMRLEHRRVRLSEGGRRATVGLVLVGEVHVVEQLGCRVGERRR